MEKDYDDTQKQLMNDIAIKSYIIPANDFILQFDIDSKEMHEQFKKGMEIIQKNIPILHMTETTSKSKTGLHITVYLNKPLNVWIRLAIQAILGSDFKREALNFNRIVNKDPFPILFYEEKK